jgi:DNA-binding NarL/FixJ family response regulator
MPMRETAELQATPPRAPRPSPRRLDELAPAELRVLELMAEGHSNSSIAEQLVISCRTVESHINHIFLKLDLRWAEGYDRRVAAVLIYLEESEPGLEDSSPGSTERGPSAINTAETLRWRPWSRPTSSLA